MLNTFGMGEYVPVSKPMKTRCKLNKDDESLLVDPMQHRSMIGSLLYLIASRPDIMQEVGMVARF